MKRNLKGFRESWIDWQLPLFVWFSTLRKRNEESDNLAPVSTRALVTTFPVVMSIPPWESVKSTREIPS